MVFAPFNLSIFTTIQTRSASDVEQKWNRECIGGTSPQGKQGFMETGTFVFASSNIEARPAASCLQVKLSRAGIQYISTIVCLILLIL